MKQPVRRGEVGGSVHIHLMAKSYLPVTLGPKIERAIRQGSEKKLQNPQVFTRFPIQPFYPLYLALSPLGSQTTPSRLRRV